MNFSENGRLALKILEEHGHEAYFVGGCVRDAIMGLPINDFDITTSAFPEETVAAFEGFRVIPTGLKHGTVTVMINGEPIEITTFRSDGEYTDHRHPSEVSFTRKLSEDLCRRDFTVNAMAYSDRTGLIDLYGGKEDIENGVIRAVGDPDTRFNEDALRIFRALRFASQKSFSIEPQTADSLKKCLPLLDHVSAERVFVELKKLLLGDGVLKVMCSYPEVICKAVPVLKPSVGFEQRNPHHIYDVYTHAAYAVAACPKNEVLRLAALLHDCGKPETFTINDGVGHFYGHTDASLRLAESALKELKCDNATLQAVLTLIKYHDPVIEPSDKAVKRMLSKIGREMLLLLLDLKSADNLAQSPECGKRLEQYERIRVIADELEAENACFSLKELAINGDDLLSIGVPKGKEIGRILKCLLDAVMENEVENSRQELLAAAKKAWKG